MFILFRDFYILLLNSLDTIFINTIICCWTVTHSIPMANLCISTLKFFVHSLPYNTGLIFGHVGPWSTPRSLAAT